MLLLHIPHLEYKQDLLEISRGKVLVSNAKIRSVYYMKLQAEILIQVSGNQRQGPDLCAQGDGGANGTQLAPTTAPWTGDLGQENTGYFSPGQSRTGSSAVKTLSSGKGRQGVIQGRNREERAENGPSEDQGQTAAAVTEHCQAGAPWPHL